MGLKRFSIVFVGVLNQRIKLTLLFVSRSGQISFSEQLPG